MKRNDEIPKCLNTCLKKSWFKRLLIPKRTIIMPDSGFWIGMEHILEYVRYDDTGLVEEELPFEVFQGVLNLREWLDIARRAGLLDDDRSRT